MKFRIERFNPETDAKPYFKDYDVELKPADRMLLDALVRIKMMDDTLSLKGQDLWNLGVGRRMADSSARRPSNARPANVS